MVSLTNLNIVSTYLVARLLVDLLLGTLWVLVDQQHAQ
jgi:hypothetical protein